MLPKYYIFTSVRATKKFYVTENVEKSSILNKRLKKVWLKSVEP